jgi:4-amino-4-deoxychorismate lyase
MSNVFLVAGTVLRTPRLDLCGVSGVMRRTVIRVASAAGWTVEECALNAADLSRADEVFLTNTRIGIWPVRELDSRALVPGPVTRRLQQLLEPLLEPRADV